MIKKITDIKHAIQQFLTQLGLPLYFVYIKYKF